MFRGLNYTWSEWVDPHTAHYTIFRVVGLERRKFPRLRPVHDGQHRRVGVLWRHPTGLLHSAHLYSVQSRLAHGPTSYQHRFVDKFNVSKKNFSFSCTHPIDNYIIYRLPDDGEMIEG